MRVAIILIGAGAAPFAVLATPLWNVLYDLYLVNVYPRLTAQELAQHPVCELGDTVLRKFQPRVKNRTFGLDISEGPDLGLQPYSADVPTVMNLCGEI